MCGKNFLKQFYPDNLPMVFIQICKNGKEEVETLTNLSIPLLI